MSSDEENDIKMIPKRRSVRGGTFLEGTYDLEESATTERATRGGEARETEKKEEDK